MKSAIVALGLLTSVSLCTTVNAGKVPDSGWMFCKDRDELKEFFLAMMKKDQTWMKSLKTCLIARPGLTMVTIEDYDSDTDIGHVAKVRLINDKLDTSLVGYTIKIKDGPKF